MGRKRARALQIAGDHLGDLPTDLGVRLVGAAKVDEGDGERLHVAARDVHAELGPGARGSPEDCQREDDGGREGQGGERPAHDVSTQCLQSSHRPTVVSYDWTGFRRSSRLRPAD